MDRRQIGEELYRQRFEAFGFSERFVFICRHWETDHGRKVTVKCRTCGKEFITWNLPEVFKGRQKRLICPECGTASNGEDCWVRSQKCLEAMAYYAEGHSQKETAKQFGVSEGQINNAVQKFKISNGRNFHKAGTEASKGAAQKASDAAKQRIIQCLDDLGFYYVGGYTNKNSNIAIRCRICYTEFERTTYSIKQGHIVCRNCEHEKIIARRQAKQKETAERKAEQRKEREAERKAKNPDGFSYYQLSIQHKLDVVHVCEVCGDEYTIRQRMENEGLKYCRDSGCCSKRCGKKKAAKKERAKGIKTIRHRVKKYGCEFDSSVSLKKLIRRDGLRCAICGEMCNPNDHEWTEYFGPMSPTIDHIKPLSKGGSHTWDNVQVAHAICNSTKRDYYEAS